MKISIKNVFKNILVFFSIFTLISASAVLFTFEQNNSFVKTDILNQQKQIIKTLKQIDKKDLELALIQYNGKSTELQYQINKLRELYEYDITGKYFLNNSNEYNNDLEKLSNLIEIFNEKAYTYYKSPNQSHDVKSDFDKAYITLEKQINSIIFKNVGYNKQKLQFMMKIAIVAFVLVTFSFLWYYSRLKKIYNDIAYLQAPSKSKKDYQISTLEADSISIRMRKKPDVKDNPNNIDPITKINNNKGLVSEYALKKNFKENNFTSVTILEVDNFSKTNRAFNQEFSQAALKKIAYTISLFEQPTDVIARTDYNQFTVILSRDSKEKAYKDMEAVREAISELKFVTQTKVPVQITVSGGFYIKPNNVVLNNAIAEAKQILAFAKSGGKNRISQKRDMEGVNI
ncbi:GGDEF domain-containing protein [Sulfurimonas lithotrophica]|uniref:GGDEF domain-containing protein n=1 Tax=Sulfurimonas lithotrophica TaxID=2590022 RepID=A0A5P8P0J1_9BACT|nr:GGDEF domain-containing protein [Sulfurimonas lithotrophica]QFR49225.1 GGDEF domain-containing protein [Sulfurimonas lithotrophica]